MLLWWKKRNSQHRRLPEVVAHRGYALVYPENTLAALNGAARAGASWVEVDVQLTKDKHPMLFHDRRLHRVCGVGGSLHDLSLAQAQQLKAAEKRRFGMRFAGEPLARLEDLARFLKSHPGLRAFVEAKPESVARFGPAIMLEKIIQALGPMAKRCVLISFSPGFLEEARQRTRLPLGLILTRWRQQFSRAASQLAPEYLFCDWRLLPRWGKLARGKSVLCVYEVRQATRALALAARGTGMIETMAVKEMLEALPKFGAAAEEWGH